jgi:serine/threonine protein kinase
MNSSVAVVKKVSGTLSPADEGRDTSLSLTRVRAEQARRWRSGERPTAEDLLSRHPELAADPEAAQVIVYGEVLLREELEGIPPDPAEYAARFPAYAAALALQFELHGALADATVSPELPGFEVVRELGRGGMGVVYLAREIALDRLVAIKVLISGEFASPAARQRFRAEAESAARMKHAHIVEVHAFGEYAGRPYMVLEYVPGGNLDQRLDGTPLDPRVAAELLRPLAEAVGHAHEAGIVHRDLKTANVLLQIADRKLQIDSDKFAVPKVSDFGLAKRLDAGGAGPTATSQILGTPSYMAPEQAVGAKDAGPAADIYSLGAILYECLTGRPPFKAATALETLAQIAGREPVAPRSLNPALPRDLETICLKCLSKVPAKRYSSAAGLAEDLTRFLDGRPVVARPVGPVGRAWRWSKRRPAVAALAASLAVLIPAALTVTTVLYLHADAQRQRAEERDRDNLRWRKRNAIAMSNHALALTRAFSDQSAIDAHRASVDEFTRLAEMGIDSAECRERRALHLDHLSLCLSRNWRADEALEVAHAAVEAFEACRREQPESFAIRGKWMQARQNLGFALRTAHRWADAANVLDQMIDDCLVTDWPLTADERRVRPRLSGAYFDRGMCRYHLGRFAEAIADYDESLRQDDGRLWADLTLARANSLAHCGRVGEALEACRGPLANPHLSANLVYDAALVHALASMAKELTLPQRQTAADHTIELLRRTLAGDRTYRKAINSDAELDSLRKRPDFRALLADK